MTSSDSYSIGGAGNLTLSGSISLMSGISGAGITKSGSGTLSLAGSSSYDAGTTIQAGTLNINADAALGAVPASAATNITFSGNSTLQAGAAAVSLNANRNIAVNSGVTATFDTQGNTMAIPGVVGGAGGLTKIGSGTLTLSGKNTYPGLTDGRVRAHFRSRQPGVAATIAARKRRQRVESNGKAACAAQHPVTYIRRRRIAEPNGGIDTLCNRPTTPSDPHRYGASVNRQHMGLARRQRTPDQRDPGLRGPTPAWAPTNLITFASNGGVAVRSPNRLTLDTAYQVFPSAPATMTFNARLPDCGNTVNGNYLTLTGDLELQGAGGGRPRTPASLVQLGHETTAILGC